jgi:AraC-like DNA-binding protein
MPLRIPARQIEPPRHSTFRIVKHLFGLLFWLVLGWGLGEEIRRTHLERDCRLLAETDLPLKVLAEQAGFSDYRHIAIVFRKKLRLSPTAYPQRTRGSLQSR